MQETIGSEEGLNEVLMVKRSCLLVKKEWWEWKSEEQRIQHDEEERRTIMPRNTAGTNRSGSGGSRAEGTELS